MKRRAVLAAGLGVGGAARAALTGRAGRWEGMAQVHGEPMPLVIDLAPTGAGGVWVGSITLPGRRVKGAPLSDVKVDAHGARFGLAAAFLVPGDPAPTIGLRWRGQGRADGTLHMAGLAAPLALRRSAAAQVDAPPVSTPIDDALLGVWVGRYELGGLGRDVTLTLARDGAGRGGGQMVIVGRRRTEVPLDLVLQGPRYLVLSAAAFGITVEGPWSAVAIDGRFEQGPFEAALPLRRNAAERVR